MIERLATSWSSVTTLIPGQSPGQEVIQHLAAPDGAELEITVEIQAVSKDGYPDTTTRIVSENARTLKFGQSSFEDR